MNPIVESLHAALGVSCNGDVLISKPRPFLAGPERRTIVEGADADGAPFKGAYTAHHVEQLLGTDLYRQVIARLK